MWTLKILYTSPMWTLKILYTKLDKQTEARCVREDFHRVQLY